MQYKFFALISRMRYIARWGLMRNTFQENIQEHSHMVADLRVLRDDHAPFVGLVLARDDVEQRGLACSIRSNERKTIEFFQAQRDPREQFPRAKRFRDLFEL